MPWSRRGDAEPTSSCCSRRSPTWRANPAEGAAALQLAAGPRLRAARPASRASARLASQARSAVTAIAEPVGRSERHDPADRPAAHARPRRRRGTRRSPPHRRFAMRSTSLDEHQGAEGRHRRHGQRRRDGDLRRRAARVPASSTTRCRTSRCGRWCRCRSAPARRRTRGRTACPSIVAELPDELRRPARARRRGATRRWTRRSASSSWCRPTALTDIPQYSSPVVATSAMRLVAPVSGSPTGCDHAGQRRDLATCPGPRQPLYFAGARMDDVHPGVDDRRGDGPEHHGAQLPRPARLRADRRPRTRCPTCGTWSTCTSTRSAGCSRPRAPTWAEPQAGAGDAPRRRSRQARPAPAPLRKQPQRRSRRQRRPQRRRRRQRRPRRRRQHGSQEDPGQEAAAKKTRPRRPQPRRPQPIGLNRFDERTTAMWLVRSSQGGPSSPGSGRAARLTGDGFRPSCRRPPPPRDGSSLAGGPPRGITPGAGRSRLRRARTGRTVGARRRPDPPADHRRRARPRPASAGRATRSASAGPAPTIFLAGTDEQHAALPARRSSAARRCGASCSREPDAGSDLATLSMPGGPRRRRVRRQRVRRSGRRWAHLAEFGILIARTDPDQPKHKGISYFICPMDLPGIDDASDRRHDDGALVQRGVLRRRAHPGALLVGDENDGWRLAKVTLSQRAGVAVVGRIAVGRRAVGRRAHRPDPRRRGLAATPCCATAAARLHIEARTAPPESACAACRPPFKGKTPGPEASIQKIMADEHGQHVMSLAKALAGADGMIAGSGPVGRPRGDEPRRTDREQVPQDDAPDEAGGDDRAGSRVGRIPMSIRSGTTGTSSIRR